MVTLHTTRPNFTFFMLGLIIPNQMNQHPTITALVDQLVEEMLRLDVNQSVFQEAASIVENARSRRVMGKVNAVTGLRSLMSEFNPNPNSAILMDMVMPVMNGVDATKQIRGSGGLNSESPIIFLSANVLGEHIQECQDAGGNDFLSKPVKRSLVIDKLREYLPNEEIAYLMVEGFDAPT